MYWFHSLAEMPLKSQGHWYSIMMGISRPSQAETLESFNYRNEEFNLLLFDRHPSRGVYIQQVSLDQAVVFMQNSYLNKNLVHTLFKKYRNSETYTPITMSKLIKNGDVSWSFPFSTLKNDIPRFQLVPSIEPFILPYFVQSQSEFREKQYQRRIRPYLGLRKAIGLPLDENLEWGNWTKRNAAFARLIYVIRNGEKHSFKPVKFCEKEDHYWDWLEGKSGNLYVRSIYIVSEKPNSLLWLQKANHPLEYNSIPNAICPTHNSLAKIASNTYAGIVPISNIFGLHARPATEIARIVSSSSGKVSISNEIISADARKPIDLFKLEVSRGSKVKITFTEFSSFAETKNVYHQIYRAANNELN